jgi:chromosome partitioning protein
MTSLNLKGGVGKTHLCWLIAGVCEERGKRCLILDLDKQGNISTTLLGNSISGPGTDSFFNPTIEPDTARLIQKSQFDHIDCIPGDFSIERFNLTDPTEWEKTGLHMSLVDALEEVAPFYDYILLDCPADISLITYAALCASDFLIVPLETADWGALGTQHVRRAYDHVRDRFNSDLQLLGYVASRFKIQRKYQKNYLHELRQHFGSDAFDTVIPDLAPFEQSVTDRIPIVLHSPTSHASTIARSFFDELEARIEKLRTGSPTSGSSGVSEPLDAVPRTH